MSIWSWWWNNVGGGGIEKGFESGKKAGEKAGDKINEATGLPDVGGAISDVNDAVNLSKVVWLNVSDYRMWRSLGWLLLGILMLILGFVIWNRKSIQAAGALAGKAALL